MENSILSEISAVIDRFKSRDAIVLCGYHKKVQKLTYKDVEDMKNEIFDKIKDKFQNCYVGLFMDHNLFIPSIILCLQGINCPFVFLDEKTCEFLGNMGVRIIISHNKYLNVNGYVHLLTIELRWHEKLFVYESKHYNKVECTNINYLIKTSGTTNTQKAVRVHHYCIYSNIKSLRNKLGINPEDVIYFGTVVTFDPSIIELYLALTTGCCLLIVSNEVKTSLSTLYDTLFRNKYYRNITFLQMCPSLFTRWNSNEIDYILSGSDLKILLLGGENFPKLKTFKNTKTRIFNIYGITEVSCWASIDEYQEGFEISLGETLDDTIFQIRDGNGKIVEREGELFIGSSERICYIDDETIESIQTPLFRSTGDYVFVKDNRIFYKNRLNDIFKRFGKQMSGNFIENEIFEIIFLENKVVYLEDKQKMVLFIKSSETDRCVVVRICDKIKIKLLHSIDKDYIPDWIEGLPSFPVTANGKIDKNKLKNIAAKIVPQKRNDGVEIFNKLWHKYLRNQRIDRNFYELGGTSILRIQFSNEFKQSLHIELPINFFDYLFTNPYNKVIPFLENYNFQQKDNLVEQKSKKIKFTDLEMSIKWKYNLEACVDSTPSILKTKKFVAVGAFSNIFSILNMENGEEINKIILPNAVESACLTTECGNFILVGCYDGMLYCLETTGKIKWRFETGDRVKNKPCFVKNSTAIVFGSYDKYFYCITIEDGKLLWKLHLNESVTANPINLVNNIFLVTIQGSCIVLDEESNVIWKKQLDSPVFSSPCLFNNDILVSEVQGVIHCLNKEGEEVWKFKVANCIYSSMTTYKNYIFFTSHDQNAYCLEFKDFDVKLKFKILLNSPSSSSVEVFIKNKEYLVTSTISGFVYLIDLQGKCIVNKLKLGGDIYSSPVRYCDKIFIGCRDNYLYCIDCK